MLVKPVSTKTKKSYYFPVEVNLNQQRHTDLSAPHPARVGQARTYDGTLCSELLKQPGVGDKELKMFYQTRRRRKHVARLENMAYIALNVLSLPASSHVVLEARDLWKQMTQELSALEVLLCVEVRSIPRGE